MQNTPAETSAEPGYMTIVQIIVSGLGLVLSLLGAALLGLIGLVALMSENPGMPDMVPLFALAWVSGLAALLAVPSVYFSVRRLMRSATVGRSLPGFRVAAMLILLWPLALALGAALSSSPLAWLFLPPLQILAIGLPIWFLVELVRRGLPAGSHQRGWGVFNASMYLTTPATVVVELLVFLILAVAVGVWVSGQPELLEELERLSLLITAGADTPEEILEAVRPYLQNPLVIAGIIGLLGGVTPLLEELIKPIALWALVGRRLNPAQGFVGGALCGAAFALIESLMNLSSITGPEWAGLAVGRAGTGLLHIGTSAFVGWGMASAWTEGKYLRLGLAFLGASVYHGLWNSLSLLPVFASAMDLASPASPTGIVRFAPAVLVFLSALMLVALLTANRRLRPVNPVVGTISTPGQEADLPPAEDQPL